MKPKRNLFLSSIPLGRLSFAATILFSLGSSDFATAASGTWLATAADANWANAANWSAIPNATGDTATFSNPLNGTIGGVSNPITLATAITLQNLTFSGSAGAYVIGANAGPGLILRGGGAGGTPSFGNSINMAAAVTNSQTVAAPISFSAASSTTIGYTFRNDSTTAAAALTVSGSINLNTAANRHTSLNLDGTNTGNNTISGVISATGNTQGNAVILKNGAGTWALSGANIVTGNSMTNTGGTQGIQVNAGVLSAQNNGALGTSGTANNLNTWINSGGTLQLAGGITLDNGVSLNLRSGGTIRSSGSNTSNGRVNVGTTAATSVTLSTVNGGDLFTLGNGTNDLTGGAADSVVNIAGPGTVLLNTASNYAGGFSINSGVLRLGSATALGSASTANVRFGSGSTGKLQLNGNSVTVASLNSNVTLGSPVIENNAAGTATLTVSNASGNSVYEGVLQNGAAGVFALTKSGAGTLTLSGNSNTYTGATQVTAGVLNVTNTTGSATGAGDVALGTATLTGSGIISGSVTVTGNSVITPGTVTTGSAGSGVLTLGNLTLLSGTTINYGFNGNPANNYISTGTLTLPSSGVVLNLFSPNTATPFAAAGTFDLFQYTGLAGTPLSNSTFSFGTSIAGYNASFGTSGGFVQLTLTASGALGTWSNANANGNWSDAGNWTGSGTLPPQAAGDSATFGATAPGTVNLDANETVGGLTFNNASGFTISGANTLSLDNNGTGANVSVAAGSQTINSAVSFKDNVTVATSSGTQLSVAGNISEGSVASSLTKTGDGTLELTGTNSYAGATNVNAGVLRFDGIGALGASAALNLGSVTTNGTLQYMTGNTDDISALTVSLNAGGGTIDTNGNNVTYANAIGNGGAGSLTKAGAGVMALSGTNTYLGGTVINGGTVAINSNASLGAVGGAVSVNNGTLQSTADITTTRNASINHANSGILVNAGTTHAVNGVVSGSGTLNKSGAGTLSLGGANTFSGAYNVNAGTLVFTSIDATGSNVINIADTTAVTLTSTAADTVGNLNFTSGTGSFTSGNTGTNYTVTGVVAAASGATGNLNITGRASLVGGSGNGTLNVYVGNANGQGDARYDINGSWSGFAGNLNFIATTASSGVRLQANSGSFNGDLSGASVDISGTAGNSMSVAGRFFTNGTMQIGALSGDAGAILQTASASGAGTFVIGAKNLNTTYAGVIQNGASAVSINKVGATGTLVLSGASTYTGATTVSAGTLLVNGSLGNTAVAVNNGGTLGGSNGTIGTGTASVAVNTGGTLAPGNSAGGLTVNGSASLGTGSTYAYQYTGGDVGADLLDVNGTLTIASGALLTLEDLGAYSVGDKFTLFAYEVLVGSFGSYLNNQTYTFEGGDWLFNYFDDSAGLNGGSISGNVGSGFVTITAVPEPNAAMLIGGFGLIALMRRRRM